MHNAVYMMCGWYKTFMVATKNREKTVKINYAPMYTAKTLHGDYSKCCKFVLPGSWSFQCNNGDGSLIAQFIRFFEVGSRA